MNSSASPSITQFFKAQRKRPRTGKEEGVTSTSKKILLEEGIVKATSGGGALEEDETLLKKPVLVVAERKIKTVGKSSKKHVAPGKKKSVEKSSDKPVAPEKEEAPGKSSDKTVALEKEASAEKPSDKTAPPEKEISAGKSSDKTVAPDKAEEKKEDAPSKRIESPVKFMKLGPLSPAKKKKMTAEQVARLLKKKTKLSELKNTLEGINQCAQKISDFRRTVAENNARMSPAKAPGREGDNNGASSSPSMRAKANLREGISPAQFYSPTADRIRADLDRLSATKASPSKLVSINNKVKKRLFEEQASPNKEDEKKAAVPAYQRFHNLAQKTPEERGSGEHTDSLELPLPYHFKVLKELFIAVETVAGIMKSRKEMMLFPKVKAGVLALFKKVSLREKHLAQMVKVLPGCYSFELQKVGIVSHIKLEVEDLVPTVVCARRKAFHAALVRICLQHHQKFLLGLAPPIVVPADKQITRWHPTFKIDEIPDIVPDEDALPTKPIPDKISSAREVIAKAQNILENANPRMQNAVKNMLNNAEADSGEKSATPVIAQSNPKAAAKVKALKGVSSSLLEKIRNREREKLLNEMTRSPAESKKLQMTKRLPNFIKIIRNMMVADKKVALPMDIVVDRLSHTVQSVSKVDTEAHLRLLVTLLPSWIKIVKLSHSDIEYVRIEKATDINFLLEEMEDIIKKLNK